MLNWNSFIAIGGINPGHVQLRNYSIYQMESPGKVTPAVQPDPSSRNPLVQVIQPDDEQPNPFSRNPPVVRPDQHLQPPPNHNTFVAIFHPVVLAQFLILAAYDYDASGGVWGVHYATVMTACWALAGNRMGHLTSYDRKTTIDKQTDDILPAGQYCYFLDGIPPTNNYAICVDFKSWPFPNAVPMAWDTVPSVQPLVGSVTSDMVRVRDGCCTMSGERYSLTSAHVVPHSERDWVRIGQSSTTSA